MSDRLRLSVAVPTFRRPALLARCLRSLAAQDLDPDDFEVVVADDGSGDDTGDVVRQAAARCGNVRLVTLEVNSGPAAARNRAVAGAGGDVILFLDDDVEATPGLLAVHLGFHRSTTDESAGLVGRVCWAPDVGVTPFMRWLDRSGLQFGYDTWLRPGPVDPPHAAFYTANLSLRRSLVVGVGGFDERFPYASFEDMELAWRLTRKGFHLQYRPEALAYHARSVDLPTFRRRTANDAASAALLRSLHPDIPIDESGREQGFIRRRRRLLMAAAAPVAERVGWDRFLSRYYQAEIAAAYLAGKRAPPLTPAAPGGTVG